MLNTATVKLLSHGTDHPTKGFITSLRRSDAIIYTLEQRTAPLDNKSSEAMDVILEDFSEALILSSQAS